MSLADYLRAAHAVLSLGDPGQSAVDAALAGQGLVRRIVLPSPRLAANLAAVAESDLAATVPGRLAVALPGGLFACPLPFAVPEFDYGLIWHPRTEATPALLWLRAAIAGLMA